MSLTTVYLLDDHDNVRRSLRDLIDAEPDLLVVRDSATADAAVADITDIVPDVVVLDVRLNPGSGLDVCRHIRQGLPDVKCLLLTAIGDDEAHRSAVDVGAHGHVAKQVRSADLLGSIRRVAAGEILTET